MQSIILTTTLSALFSLITIYTKAAALALLIAIMQISPVLSAGDFAAVPAPENTPAIVPGRAQMQDIDRAIELELIKLARFNIRFHQTANRHQWWRTYSYALAREAGTAVGLSGTLTDLVERGRGFNRPKIVSKTARRRATQISIIGSAISGGASGLELAQNTWIMMQARKKGYSPGDANAFVCGSVKRTNQLLQQRDQLVASEFDPKLHKARELESALLRHIRQQLLYEYRKWSSSSRELAWRENCFYTIDSLQNFAGMTSNLLTLRSFHSPSKVGAASIWLLVSNSAATVNPILSNFAGFCIRKYQHNKIAHEFLCERPVLKEGCSVAEINQLKADTAEEKIFEEASFLSGNSEKMDTNIDREVSEIARLRQIAQQQAISGPLIGLTSTARGILATTAYYGYRENRRTGNRMLFVGRISQATGQSYALVNTPYTIIKGVLKKREMEKRNALPSQVLEQRLRRLDLLEQHTLAKHPSTL